METAGASRAKQASKHNHRRPLDLKLRGAVRVTSSVQTSGVPACSPGYSFSRHQDRHLRRRVTRTSRIAGELRHTCPYMGPASSRSRMRCGSRWWRADSNRARHCYRTEVITSEMRTKGATQAKPTQRNRQRCQRSLNLTERPARPWTPPFTQKSAYFYQTLPQSTAPQACSRKIHETTVLRRTRRYPEQHASRRNRSWAPRDPAA